MSEEPATLQPQKSIVFGDLDTDQDLKKILNGVEKDLDMAFKTREKLEPFLYKDRYPDTPGEEMDPMNIDPTLKVETAYSAKLEPLRTKIEDLFPKLKELSRENINIMDEVIDSRRQVTDKLTQLFEYLDLAIAKKSSEYQTLLAELRELENGGTAADQMGILQSKLEQLKADRCIFFGCIDMHPPDLWEFQPPPGMEEKQKKKKKKKKKAPKQA